jgi:uroporphyrinogen-III synthase
MTPETSHRPSDRAGSAPRVALLEARMSSELARLVEKHGGIPVCVPAVRESRELDIDLSTVDALVSAIVTGRYDFVVFMTGVSVSLLFDLAERLGRRADLVAGLGGVTTVCRGPKPTAALRGFGVTPTLTARAAFTSAEVIDVFANIDVSGRRVLLFHYGERSDSLAETLLARGAALDEQWLYRWRLPDDTAALERLIGGILNGEVDALAVTCQIQIRHLFQIAERLGVDHDLVEALNDHVVVAAVGPTCHAILQVHGVQVDVMPDHPKMGPLIVSLMRHFDRPSGNLSRTELGKAELLP